ncbi:hypothetical protein, partial [Planococcus sp. CAU13]|uniref:hypothetical protein n=1 Tax=Planococcus sp. CAU13 TaxID=1541197 RepID=UPI00052FFFDD
EEEEAITDSRSDLCDLVENIGLLEKNLSEGSYEVPPAVLNCEDGDTSIITITMYSTGYASNGTDKLIEGKMEITPPEIKSPPTSETGPPEPSKPKNNTGLPTISKPPATVEVRQFLETDEPFEINRTAYHFESLVINSPLDNALNIASGKGGESLTVAKDLYIKGGIYANNHVCIYVQGNITILGDIDLNAPHMLIQVYGNAYFKTKPKLNNPNSALHVIGDTYIENTKTFVTDFKKLTKTIKGCSSSIDWPESEEVEQPGTEYKWDLNSELNAIYH